MPPSSGNTGNTGTMGNLVVPEKQYLDELRFRGYAQAVGIVIMIVASMCFHDKLFPPLCWFDDSSYPCGVMYQRAAVVILLCGLATTLFLRVLRGQGGRCPWREFGSTSEMIAKVPDGLVLKCAYCVAAFLFLKARQHLHQSLTSSVVADILVIGTVYSLAMLGYSNGDLSKVTLKPLMPSRAYYNRELDQQIQRAWYHGAVWFLLFVSPILHLLFWTPMTTTTSKPEASLMSTAADTVLTLDQVYPELGEGVSHGYHYIPRQLVTAHVLCLAAFAWCLYKHYRSSNVFVGEVFAICAWSLSMWIQVRAPQT